MRFLPLLVIPYAKTQFMTQLVKYNFIGRLVAAILFMVACPAFSQAQTYIETFGQNRMQLRKFDWKFFDTKHFRVYHYDRAGRQLGRYVAEEAENSIATVEKKLGGKFPQRFNIILYNSYDEYRQSNIGLKDESQMAINTKAGTLNLVGDKLVVYFTGEHTDLQRQLRTGMATVVMQRMIFGENFKKMVKNALLLNLPEWVTTGYISFLVDGWDTRANSAWKGILDAQPKTGFFEIADQNPEIAGKAFWKFINDQYGPGMVKNLLYSMQQKTSLNKAMMEPANLNMKVTQAYDSCIKYYKAVYTRDARNQEAPDSAHGLIALKAPKGNTTLRNILVSPRGSDICYVAWTDGRYTVYSQKTTGEKELSVIVEGGQKDLTEQTDPNYPMIAWSATGYKLAVLYKEGEQTRLRIYNSLKGRIENAVIPANRCDRILGMSFMDDDEKMIFSAIKKSQTDLYMFITKGAKLVNITDDPWDDLAPQYITGGSRTGILFLSNRPVANIDAPIGVNELPTGANNVFFYNTKTMSKELVQLTSLKGSRGVITQPIQYGPDNFAYLLDSNGINNKYVVLFARNKKNKDSAYSVPVTNYNSGIISHQYNVASGDVADVVQSKDKYVVYFHELQLPGKDAPVKKLTPTYLSEEKTRYKKPVQDTVAAIYKGILDNNTDDEPAEPEIKSGNLFQSEFADDGATRKHKVKARHNPGLRIGGAGSAPDSSQLNEITDSAYVKMKPSPYRLSFKPDFLSIKLNNCVLFSQYQSISTNGGLYANPSLGALTTLSLNELMEDHRITAGFQLPINTSGSSYFLQYQNFTHRMDWGLMFLRTTDKQTMTVAYMDANNKVLFTQDQLFKTINTMVQSDFSYPLDRLRSVRFHTALRQDKLIEKATDTLSLTNGFPITNNYTSLSRLEYVFDNTVTPAMNILNGTRYKLYAEYIYGLNNGNKGCYNFGLDFRNYQKIYKNFILANRLAYAHSDGTAEVQYLVGGVDNWIGAQTGPNAGQAPDPRYGFQAMTTPLRGYKQYARTGNNFLVFNTEFRLPILTTFLKRPIQSAVLKNLQFVAFADAAGAWKGFLPDAESMNSTYKYPARGYTPGLNNVALTLTVPNSGGLALGYGAGLRTMLFGYFARLDFAWNIDGNPKPIVYFGLGTDF